MAFWRYQPEVSGPTSIKHLGNQKRTKIDSVKAGGRSDEAAQNPTRRKRKQERIIEDSCGDPHTYHIPQRHALY